MIRNFKDRILQAAGGKPIEAIVIGRMGQDDDYLGTDKPPYEQVVGKLLSWDEAAPIVDYSYDTDFGAPGCQAITAWTEDLVIFVSQYDGATSVEGVPRNPVPHIPNMPGG